MRIVLLVVVSIISLVLLGASELNAKSEKYPNLIVSGTLVYKDGSAAIDKRIYFFSIYNAGNSGELSAQTTFKDGYISNPSDVTKDDGNFVIKINSGFFQNTESKKFSIGLLRGFGPSFSILRNQDGIAVPIDYNFKKNEKAEIPVTINVGRIIVDQ